MYRIKGKTVVSSHAQKCRAFPRHRPVDPMASEPPLDMDMVRSGLFLGSQTAEQAAIERLRTKGTTHVLQLGTNNVTLNPSHPHELTYLCIAIHENDEADLITALRKHKAREFKDFAVQRPNSLLAHCQMGMSRSAMSVVVYLMLRESLTFWDAMVQLQLQQDASYHQILDFADKQKQSKNAKAA